jgi:hypothetical protein
MNLTTTTCECCPELIHHVSVPNDCVTFDGDSFELHLSGEELTQLYFTLKEVQCA